MRNRIITAAAAALSLAAAPALGEVPRRSRVVVHADLDLDLGTGAGRDRLDRRIAAAIEAVCGSYAGAPDFEAREIDRCRAAARTGVETQLVALGTRGSRRSASSR